MDSFYLGLLVGLISVVTLVIIAACGILLFPSQLKSALLGGLLGALIGTLTGLIGGAFVNWELSFLWGTVLGGAGLGALIGLVVETIE